MTPTLRTAIDLSVEVLEGKEDTVWQDAARKLARAVVEFAGAGAVQEQNERLEEWARGADERVGRASTALEAANIGSGPLGATLSIADRVALLAKQRDEARERLEKLELAAPVMLAVMALLADEADVAGLREVALWFYNLDPEHLNTWLDAERARADRQKANEQPGGVTGGTGSL